MKTFLQSDIWLEINKNIFKKPIFEIIFGGKKYFGIIKEQKKILMKFRWYQILGIELNENRDNNFETIKKEFQMIKRDYGKGFSDIMFQFGFINIIDYRSVKDLNDINNINEIKEKREKNQKLIKEKLNLEVSFRENMPLATVIFDLSNSIEQLWQEIKKSTREKINKAKNKELYFDIAKFEDFENFYEVWYSTSYKKGFNIIDKKTFLNLVNYLNENNKGKLFLVKLKDQIVAGSLCIFFENTIYYLYGGTNRTFGNISGHHFLKFELFKRGIANGYKFIDLFGTSPTGFPAHHLAGISKFKQSLGGKKIEYLGNYDLILNKNLYNGFKIIKNI